MQNSSTDILNELKEISPLLAGAEKTNLYSVPDNYFADLEDKISTIVFLNQEGKEPVQKVPVDYFDSLSDKILSKIRKDAFVSAEDKFVSAEDEIKTLSPALYYLKSEPGVFTVPDTYFNGLSDRILQKISGKPAKVVKINHVRNWYKFAAAAVVAILIGISTLKIYNHNNADNKIAKTYIELSSQYKTPEKLDEGIAALSDDEIAKYLEKTGNILDDETLIQNTDVQSLPDDTDYLLNENTLNEYLKSIGSKSINSN